MIKKKTEIQNKISGFKHVENFIAHKAFRRFSSCLVKFQFIDIFCLLWVNWSPHTVRSTHNHWEI